MGQSAAQRILLCGFMGCGKTSVGQALSFRLKWDFLDTDAMIEKKEGMSIPKIFSEKGESYFRQAETDIAHVIAKRRNAVVSTGGGFLMKPDTRQAFFSNAAPADNTTAIVFLDCSFEVCYQRIRNSSRPLVVNNSKEDLQKIFEQRAAIYRSVSTTQVGNDGLISEAVDEILKQVVIL